MDHLARMLTLLYLTSLRLVQKRTHILLRLDSVAFVVVFSVVTIHTCTCGRLTVHFVWQSSSSISKAVFEQGTLLSLRVNLSRELQ